MRQNSSIKRYYLLVFLLFFAGIVLSIFFALLIPEEDMLLDIEANQGIYVHPIHFDQVPESRFVIEKKSGYANLAEKVDLIVIARCREVTAYAHQMRIVKMEVASILGGEIVPEQGMKTNLFIHVIEPYWYISDSKSISSFVAGYVPMKVGKCYLLALSIRTEENDLMRSSLPSNLYHLFELKTLGGSLSKISLDENFECVVSKKSRTFTKRELQNAEIIVDDVSSRDHYLEYKFKVYDSLGLSYKIERRIYE